MTLRDQDLRLLCEALVRFLSPFGEVVIHDVASQTIRHIAGNLSNREVGDPSFLEELNLSTQPDAIVGPYRKTAADGRLIKSISVFLRGDLQASDLLLCINMDASYFETVREVLSQFISSPPNQPENPFADDWLEKLNEFIARWSLEQRVTVRGMTPDDRKRLLTALRARGVFDRPKAAIAVAAAFGVSRATVYQDLRALDHRPKREESLPVVSSNVTGEAELIAAPKNLAARSGG